MAGPTPDVEGGVASALEQISERMAARDLEGVLGLFGADEGVIFAGSEASELARGREEIRKLLRSLFDRNESYAFEWKRRDVSGAGGLAWVFAEGSLVVRGDDGTVERLPYRTSGVLERVSDRWLWRMYIGSEPIEAVETEV